MEMDKQPTVLKTAIIEDNNFYNSLLTKQILISNEEYAQDYNYIYDLSSFTSPEGFKNNFDASIELAFVDYYLESKTTGIDILKFIKSTCPECKVIMVSQSMNQNIAEKSFQYGAYEYVLKDTKALKKIRDILSDHVFERYKQNNP